MGYLQIEGRIASIRRLSTAAFDILLFAPELAESAVPGQFLHIRCGEQPLRRPISICEIDRNIGALRIVFEVRGKGTAWLSERQMGDAVDLLGPLGNGFSLPESGEGIILIGGGIGTPPLLSVAQTLPGQTEAILGFRNADACILARDFALACANVQIATVARLSWACDRSAQRADCGEGKALYGYSCLRPHANAESNCGPCAGASDPLPGVPGGTHGLRRWRVPCLCL